MDVHLARPDPTAHVRARRGQVHPVDRRGALQGARHMLGISISEHNPIRANPIVEMELARQGAQARDVRGLQRHHHHRTMG